MSSTTTPPESVHNSINSTDANKPYRVFDDRPFRVDGPLAALAFTGEAELSSVEEPGLLRHWDVSGSRQRDWHFLSDLETLWAFNASGTLLGAGNDELAIWDAVSGKLRTEWEQPSWVTALAFNSASDLIATGHDDGLVRLWEVSTQRLVREIEAGDRPVSAIAFSRDGSRLASAGEDKLIHVWESATGKTCGSMVGHTDRIPSLAWDPKGHRLFSAGWDTTVRVWDTTTCEPIILLNSHANQVYTLAINAAGTLLASADAAHRIHVWDIAKYREPQVFEGHESEIRTLAFSPDGKRLVSGGEDRILRFWSIEANQDSEDKSKIAWQRALDAKSPTDGFALRIDLSLSPDGKRLASLGSTGVRLWDVNSSQVVLEPENGSDINAIRFSPDGKWLAGGGADARIRLWDAGAGKRLTLLEGQDLPLTALAFSPNSATLASSGTGGADVWLWNLVSKEPALVIPEAAGGGSVESLAFHPNGQLLAAGGIDWLATGGSDGRTCIWDVTQHGGPLFTLKGGTTSLAFHPSGRWLASSSLTRTVRIWEGPNWSRAVELAVFTEMVTSVAYSPDGQWLATGGEDHTLRLWRAADHQLVGIHELDTQIKAVTFTADSRFVFTGNGNASCYRIAIEQLLS